MHDVTEICPVQFFSHSRVFSLVNLLVNIKTFLCWATLLAMHWFCIPLNTTYQWNIPTMLVLGQSWPNGLSVGLVTRGCGFKSRLWQELSTTEVRPLNKAPIPQLLPGCRSDSCTYPSVCALGWVKCRAHISLLVILCIIVYVTNTKLLLYSTTQMVWGEPKLNHSLYRQLQPEHRWKWVFEFEFTECCCHCCKLPCK